jgi:hypothetical protein
VRLLKAIGLTLGDWAYAVLITFGWQPRSEREKPPV